MSGRDPLSGVTPVTSTGAVYPLATIDYYIVGTTTREDTFTTAALTVAHSNPITLGADGRIPEIFFSQTRMKRVFKDADGNTISGLSWDGIDKSVERIKSASAPSPTYPGLQWHDTSTGNLKERNAANSAWIDRGAIDSVGNTASVTETLTGTETAKVVTPDGLAGIWQRGTNITPSAGTVSLPSTGGGVFNVAAGNFSAISSAQGGRKVLFVMGGASTITHNATSMILPFGVNEITAAGDIYEFTNEAAADASGTNWRCTNRIKAVGTVLSKTASYTVLDADRGTTIRFSGLSGDATVTLPAAAGRAGFEVTIACEHVFADNVVNTTPYGVIVDPNGAELIDGFATRKSYGFSRITIVCDGTGWRTKSGKWRYFSGNQTISAAGGLTLAHGLGVAPKQIWCRLQCTTAELAYTQYDIVDYPMYSTDGVTVFGSSIVADATNLNVRQSASAVWAIPHKTTGAFTNITAASWRAQYYAED